MTYTLLDDVVISCGLVLVADKVGRRKILAIGSILMSISGITFSYASNFWILLAAAVFGVTSPSGNEIGPFKTIEESTLAHVSDLATRSELYRLSYATGVRGTCFGLTAAIGKVGAVVGTQTFTSINDHLKTKWTLIIAAICDLVGVIITFFFVPKLNGEDLMDEDNRSHQYLIDRNWQGVLEIARPPT
ncbi:major facilitator superfamily domain-containing protein [Lipomyces starkeyi]